MNAIDWDTRQDAAITLAGQVLYLALGYATTLLIARVLGARALGIYSIAVFTLTTARLVCTLGLPQACLRYIPLYRAGSQEAWVRGLLRFASRVAVLLGLALAAVLGGGVLLAGDRLFNDPLLPAALAIALAALPIYALQGTWAFALQGFQAIRHKALVDNVVEPAARLAGLLLLVVAGVTLLAPVMGLVASALLSALTAVTLLRRHTARLPSDVPTRVEPRPWLGYSLPLALNSLIALLQPGIPLLLIEGLHGSDQVGIYNAVYKTAALIAIPVVALNTVFAPRIAAAHSRAGSRAALEAQFKTMTAWTMLVSLPLALALLLFPAQVMGLFGAEFEARTGELALLAVANFVYAACGSAGCLLAMTGRSGLSLLNALASAGVSVALYLWLIPPLAITGAAVGITAGLAILSALSLAEVLYLLRMHPFSRGALTPLIAGALTAALLIVLPAGGLDLPRLIVFSPAYLAFLWLASSRAERSQLRDVVGVLVHGTARGL